MKTIFIGQNSIRLDRTDSTNSYLTRISSERKLPEGTVVIADCQEKGRGQRGTFWESEPGKNLTFSLLLYPSFLKPDEQFRLSKAVAVSVAEFIRQFASSGTDTKPDPGFHKDKVKVKWPNDIYIGNKKVAGILIENSVNGNFIGHSVIGIGVNINQDRFSSDLQNPSSLKIAAGKEFDLYECFENLCSCIESNYLLLKQAGSSKIDVEYLNSMFRLDEWASYKYMGKTITAKINGITKIGKLILEKENGELLECEVKEVAFL
jgi:BirA family biotin operon repressor/biotin-[acetyl-CoA-carboxylase] ligase